jgi:glycosyltransferase involved in cell wall biosynthesis
MKYKFTVFTPAWNSEAVLHRVIESLEIQTFRDFEWIIVDDASQDGTVKLVEDYKKNAKFPIKIITKNKNSGLTESLKIALQESEGEFFLTADHDDRFIANSLEVFMFYWLNANESKIPYKLSGVGCPCQDQNGKIVGNVLEGAPRETDYFELYFGLKVKGEKWFMTKTVILKEALTHHDLLHGQFIWMKISEEYQSIFINIPLRIYYTNQSEITSMSHSKYLGNQLIAWKGYLYIINEVFFKKINVLANFRYYLITIFLFCRFAYHSNIGFRKQMSLIQGRFKFINSLIFCCILPISIIFVRKDNIEGRI